MIVDKQSLFCLPFDYLSAIPNIGELNDTSALGHSFY